MYDNFYFENQVGVKSSDLHIFFEKYPAIKMGQEEFQKKTIPGRGNVSIKTGTLSDTEIDMTLDVNVLGYQDKRLEAYLKAREFLETCKRVTFCDNPDYFYKVKYAKLEKVTQYIEEAGDFGATFVCEPGIFLKSGVYEYEKEEVLYNPYSICKPTYIITGEGQCTLNVNGKTMAATVGQNLTINTDLMISYRVDGTMQNTAVSGQYDDLYLQHGKNTIYITSGFGLKVIPNWRCL